MEQAVNPETEKSLPFFGIPRLFPYLKKYRKTLTWMVVCGLLGTGVDILMPLLQRYALNHFIAGNTLDTLPWYIIIYVAAIVFASWMNFVSCNGAMRTEVSVNRDLRTEAFNHLQTLSFSYFNQNSVGWIHSRVMSDTSRIGSLVSWTMMDAVWHTSYLVGSLAVMLAINARLALLVMTILPLIVILFSLFQKKLILANRKIRELNSRITGDFNEGITGAKTIKTLVVEDKMAGDFVKDTAEMKRTSVRAARLRGAFAVTMNLASSLALAIVLWQGGYIAASEVGTFSMFMSYAQGMMEPVRWIVDAISDVITTQVNIERLTRLLGTKSDVTDTPEVIERYGDAFSPKKENWEPIRGDIEFEDVSFRYPDGDEYVLEHFNLKIPFGSNIAIVGETGAGKSTLVNLVCRFFEPTEGRVLIDGRDARERSQLWLHSAIGYVLQTPHLFSGTIRENLLYGNPNATEEEIERALKLVSADEVVARMEKGIDTDVGEGGDLLSTGEKQLISFARAILADPRILVLDEATASVDTLTEQKIQSAIDTIIQGRTSLVIAHRLSTVRNADLILVVRDGKIVEQGTHAELLKKKGHYFRLYTRQYEDEATPAPASPVKAPRPPAAGFREAGPPGGPRKERGYDAVSLREGYGAWLRKNLSRESRQEEIEDSLRRVRRFRENLMTPFTKAVRIWNLLQPGDRVAVCISGGKDSMLMAKLFQELQRHRKFPFELVFLVMDPGYNELNRLLIEANAEALGIPITVFHSDIFDIVDQVPKSPCYLCARMRRGHLYKQARDLGCNKIALGHHYDDVIETILMGMLWSGQFQTMMPRVHSKNFEGMELIRPMSLIREEDIKAWRDYHGLHFIQCACHFTDTCSSCREDGTNVSKRMETKLLIRKLHETNPDVEAHLFNSARCVNLDTVLGYRLNGEEHSFLEKF